MLNIDYRESDRRAVLAWGVDDASAVWLDVLRRLLFDHTDDATQEDGYRISLPWWSFVALRNQLLEIFKGYDLTPGESLAISLSAAEMLRQSKRSADGYTLATTAHTIPEADLRARLSELGFARSLSPEQARNVSKIAALPAAATFSVPGAGKTTEALATFFYRARDDERLLVVAPKNAFAAWDEQIADCMPDLHAEFARLRSGKDKIAKILDNDPRFMLITYQQLARVPDLLAAHCARYKVHVYLDESHRIKSGIAKQTARAALALSCLPVGKLIMSGTPMPQSVDDLIPQFAFLYPEIAANTDNVVDLIRPVYVRTNKTELGLPPVTRVIAKLPMAPMQHELYKLMKFEVAREAASALSIRNKQAFRSLGRSVARLLQFVSNPSLLSTELAFAHPDLLAAALAEGDGPKLKYVLRKVRQLAREGQKVLIWSSFVRNVEYIAERLADLGAVYIHGGVDAGDEDDDETREGKIKLFHDDANVRVMVANPAAASEGVSLHRICHHAIYLDRTFNAAHYLQSEDRIHRFGLPADQATTIEIVECIDSVDETVRERLSFKIGKMAEALDDSSLKPDPIPIDPNDIEDFEEFSTGLLPDDVQALLRDLSKEG
ncbi:DEAD/DEAH box helicase [Janthinobacterium sp. SUN176]|uniref:DEAD/DEAH box helicase n=1 Tax=Janthinobacterium sp. SUN176 TaxID=3014788 RepID=UPI002712E59C|nr:DEAD/DEAH box helicase [Janthinobacterium sp. SUN176]MDO8074829.1 DEAD/DEAH box helicase [Janthinobacterium sp. SUN176]